MSIQHHALYRFYDKDDDLLYVGVTFNITTRWNGHADSKPWWSEVFRCTVEHHENRASALLAERAAIATEKPRYNVTHNRGHRQSPQLSDDSDRHLMLTLEQAAQRFAVSTKTIRRYISAGRLRGYRMGPRLLRVSADELTDLLRPIPTASRP